jgi:hypothetical protein
MITDDSKFLPLRPRRLVAAADDVELGGPGTRFTTGQLVDEPIGARLGSGSVLVLTARKR